MVWVKWNKSPLLYWWSKRLPTCQPHVERKCDFKERTENRETRKKINFYKVEWSNQWSSLFTDSKCINSISLKWKYCTSRGFSQRMRKRRFKTPKPYITRNKRIRKTGATKHAVVYVWISVTAKTSSKALLAQIPLDNGNNSSGNIS